MKLSGLPAPAICAAVALLPAYAQQPQPAAQPNASAAPAESRFILAWSKPAAGSTVSVPVNDLVLHFSPPARLGEVTVTGPEGAMPMMVTAVGEVEHYSLPLQADAPAVRAANIRAASASPSADGVRPRPL